MLKVPKERLDISPGKPQCSRDREVVGAGNQQGRRSPQKRGKASREWRGGGMPAMGHPGVSQVAERGPEPEFPASGSEQVKEPTVEPGRDDPGSATRRVIPRRENGFPAIRPTVPKVDANRLDVGIPQLEPTLRLDEQSGNSREGNHGTDARQRMNQRTIKIESIRDHKPGA